MRHSVLVLALLATHPFLVDAANAQETCRLQRLQRFLPASGTFGTRLAHDGEHLLVTASSGLLTGTTTHELLLHQRGVGGWTELGPLAPGPDGGASGLAAAGGEAFLGRPTGAGGGPGEVVVFALAGPSTAVADVLVDPDAQPGASFGASVACDGTFLAVGAPGYVDASGASGAVHVYERLAGAWQHRQRLTTTAGSVVRLGDTVDVAGDVVVAGAPLSSSGTAPFVGRAVLFRFLGTTWAEDAQLTAPDAAPHAQFGASVAAEPGRVAIGAPANFNASQYSGSVYVYDDLFTSWALDEELVCPPHAAPGGEFGTALDLYFGRLLVGAPNLVGPTGLRGSLHLYDRGAGGWASTAVLEPEPGLPFGGSCLGASALLDGGLAFGGAGCSVGSLGGATAEVYAFAAGDDFPSLGDALPGTLGAPVLEGLGCAVAGFDAELALSNALPAAPALLVGSKTLGNVPLFGGVLRVAPPFPLLVPFVTDGAGAASFPFALDPSTFGQLFFLQAGVVDAGAVAGVALTNGLAARVR